MNPHAPNYGNYPNAWMRPQALTPQQLLQQQQFMQAAAFMQQNMAYQQPRMPFAFQPLFNHSSMMSMPPPMRQHQPRQPRAAREEYPAPSGESEVEILNDEEVDHVGEALQTNPNFMQSVDASAVNSAEPNVFQIDQEMYPLAAWKRVDARLATSQQFKQWFNYGLTPKTWTQYAQKQRKVQASLKAHLSA
jgi:hypothetical protein